MLVDHGPDICADCSNANVDVEMFRAVKGTHTWLLLIVGALNTMLGEVSVRLALSNPM